MSAQDMQGPLSLLKFQQKHSMRDVFQVESSQAHPNETAADLIACIWLITRLSTVHSFSVFKR